MDLKKERPCEAWIVWLVAPTRQEGRRSVATGSRIRWVLRIGVQVPTNTTGSAVAVGPRRVLWLAQIERTETVDPTFLKRSKCRGDETEGLATTLNAA